ncbi:hypothetical protein BC826DRAFT_1173353 [Russula brevipes]|nr:hypothetical protein BC826DRAFT_1173353 [Russula brevipes]
MPEAVAVAKVRHESVATSPALEAIHGCVLIGQGEQVVRGAQGGRASVRLAEQGDKPRWGDRVVRGVQGGQAFVRLPEQGDKPCCGDRVGADDTTWADANAAASSVASENRDGSRARRAAAGAPTVIPSGVVTAHCGAVTSESVRFVGAVDADALATAMLPLALHALPHLLGHTKARAALSFVACAGVGAQGGVNCLRGRVSPAREVKGLGKGHLRSVRQWTEAVSESMNGEVRNTKKNQQKGKRIGGNEGAPRVTAEARGYWGSTSGLDTGGGEMSARSVTKLMGGGGDLATPEGESEARQEEKKEGGKVVVFWGKPWNTHSTAGTGNGLSRVQHRTRTRDNRDRNTAGKPVPVTNPNVVFAWSLVVAMSLLGDAIQSSQVAVGRKAQRTRRLFRDNGNADLQECESHRSNSPSAQGGMVVESGGPTHSGTIHRKNPRMRSEMKPTGSVGNVSQSYIQVY